MNSSLSLRDLASFDRNISWISTSVAGNEKPKSVIVSASDNASFANDHIRTICG
jgi:hypothetical protein